MIFFVSVHDFLKWKFGIWSIFYVCWELVVISLQEAQNAKEKTHGYKLDKAHIFAVNMFDDFDRLMNVKEEWEAPQTKPYSPGVCVFLIGHVPWKRDLYYPSLCLCIQFFVLAVLLSIQWIHVFVSRIRDMICWLIWLILANAFWLHNSCCCVYVSLSSAAF